MQSSDINQAVQKLISENRFEQGEITIGEPFKVEDIFSTFGHLFNAKATVALNNRTHGVIHQRNEYIPQHPLLKMLGALGVPRAQEFIDNNSSYIRVIDKVQFLASRSKDIEGIPKAIEKVVGNINILASYDFVTATLLPLSILRIANIQRHQYEYIVISYIAVTSAGESYMDNNMANIKVKEGDMPPYTEDQ